MRMVLWSVVVALVMAGCIDEPAPWTGKDVNDATGDVRKGDGVGDEIRSGDGKLGDTRRQPDAPDTRVPDVPDVKVVDLGKDVADVVPDVVVDVVDAKQPDLPGDQVALPDNVPDGAGDVAIDISNLDIPPDEVCIPDCTDMACGDDGCGGSCGECEDQIESCIVGVCHADYCGFGLEEFGCCVEDVLLWCDPDDGLQWTDCAENNAPYDICGWDGLKFGCGGTSEAPDDEPDQCCEPDCGENECGADGCWGICGEFDGACPGTQDQCEEGQCVCKLACEGKECGPDGCGGMCGELAGACPGTQDECDEGKCECQPACDGKDCGDDGCGGTCGTCELPDECSGEGKCICQAQCEGKECGQDGCGGECGDCDDGKNCTSVWCEDGKCMSEIDSFSCVIADTCIPSGTENPENPCEKCKPGSSKVGWSALEDGTSCGADKACYQGACCDYGANCQGKDCGDDLCGGICGTCDENQVCQDGNCECAHVKCGSVCCGPDQQCNQVLKQCCVLQTCDENEVECGPMDNGCGVEIDCGKCQDDDLCDGELTCQAGKCVNGDAPVCDDGNSCTVGSCVPAAGACVQENKTDSTPCEAPLICVGQCLDGECQDVAEEVCDGQDNDCNEAVDEGFPDDDSDDLANCVDLDDDNDGYLDEADCEPLDPGIPSCEGMECGDDGCGGSCGACDLAGMACQVHQCVYDCGDGNCLGDENCSTCPGDCGDCCGNDLCDADYGETCDGCPADCGECCGNGVVGADEECDDGNDVDWDGCTGCEITEFQVNTFTQGPQIRPDVAALENGGFVLVWDSHGQDAGSSGYGVIARVYNADGTPLGDEIIANATEALSQEHVSVAPMRNGGFVVTWKDQSGVFDSSSGGIVGRVFDGAGSPVSDEFLVNTGTEGEQFNPDVASFSDGTFVVVWLSLLAPNRYLYGQLFDHLGTPVGAEFDLAEEIVNPAGSVGVAVGPSDEFVVTWFQNAEQTVRARRFEHSGNPIGAAFAVSDGNESGNQHQVAAYSQIGQFIVAWRGYDSENGWDVEASLFSPTANPVWSQVDLPETKANNQNSPAVTFLSATQFVAAWDSAKQDESPDASVFFRIVGTNQVPVTSEIPVNTFITEHQNEPAVAALQADRFVIAYQGYGAQDGDEWGVFARIFKSDGSPLYPCDCPLENQWCDLGECTCVGPVCGDGCCAANAICVDGECCTPDCFGKECGNDGCGASCGTCGACNDCQGDECITVCWTDPVSALTWQNPPAGSSMLWSAAKQYCADLDLDGGGWHLPAIGELRSLIRGCPATEAGGSCNVEAGDCLAASCIDGSCNSCPGDVGPADGCYWPDEMHGACGWYWSSSPVADNAAIAWNVEFDRGGVDVGNVISYARRVRCARDAP